MINLGRALGKRGGWLVGVTGALVDIGHLLFQKGCWYNCRRAWKDKRKVPTEKKQEVWQCGGSHWCKTGIGNLMRCLVGTTLVDSGVA
jgi:hypothetical protein